MLAAFQAGDLIVTQVSPRYGDAHLDHLGVPRWLRPVLPAIKLGAVVALVATANRRTPRSGVAAALVPYYTAAVTFHVMSSDSPDDVAAAGVCAALAMVIV
jgi:hypothetical protein